MTTRNLGTLTVPEALAVRLDAELDRARKVSGTSRSGLIRQLCHEALTPPTPPPPPPPPLPGGTPRAHRPAARDRRGCHSRGPGILRCRGSALRGSA